MKIHALAVMLVVCGGVMAGEARLSDWERPTLLKTIQATKDPIRADLEASLKKVMTLLDRDPDEEWCIRNAEPIGLRYLQLAIAEATAKHTVVSRINRPAIIAALAKEYGIEMPDTEIDPPPTTKFSK